VTVWLFHVRRAASATAIPQNTCCAQPPSKRSPPPNHTGTFSAAAVKAAISAEVQQAVGCDPEERRRRIRALQLRCVDLGETEPC